MDSLAGRQEEEGIYAEFGVSQTPVIRKGESGMFVHAVPDNRGNKDGYYCSLVEARRVNGIPTQRIIISFGFIPSERLPYLKAAFNRGDPEATLANEKRSQEEKRRSAALHGK